LVAGASRQRGDGQVYFTIQVLSGNLLVKNGSGLGLFSDGFLLWKPSSFSFCKNGESKVV